jgi:transcription elongation factor Elf1
MSLYIESKYVRLISSRLRNFKQKKDYLWNFSCPFCGDSQKNKTKARGYVYAKGNNLFYRCHNCGISTSAGNLVKHADPSLYQEFVLERYKSGESNTTNFKVATLNIPTTKFGKVEKQKVFEHAEYINRLPSGHFCLEYLTKRKIPTELYGKLLFTSHYKKFVDEVVPNHGKEIVDDARLVIPYYDEYDQLIAVSGRALETSDKTLRYVTIRTNDSEDKLVYGLDRVNLNETVYMVEGPIDSLFLDNCIASGDANLALTAKSIDAKDIVLIWDNECRNKEIVKMMQNALQMQYNIVIWPDNMQGKDINEMILHGCTKNEIQRIISSNTYKGLKAQVQLNNWKKI